MMLIINAIICSLIVLRLALFVRTGRHRICISICAYLITVAAGVEVILTLYGQSSPGYCNLFLNAVLCAAIYRAKGNIAHLFDSKRATVSGRLPRPTKTYTKMPSIKPPQIKPLKGTTGRKI
ncbi:phage holin family protein [Shewanella baltica]|uniref:phage holin family protein n=1 Tax=Shewanella baltica TaxID=62322 RepID=UPI0035C77CAC